MDRKNYLRTKTAVPQVLHKVVPRKSIADVINSAALDKAVCFVAPYGYGKTLSVISWLRECGKDAVWVTLDDGDDSEHVFFAHLAAAMLRFGGRQGDVDDILADPAFVVNPTDFLWQTISAIEQNLRDKILVVDDFRFIRDPALFRLFKNVISGLLGRWQVIIISRSELPSAFTELILKGRVCLVTPGELSFNAEEITEFFCMNGCAVAQQDALRIRGETEGWPASLNVILAVSREGYVTYGESARSYIMTFFETEIWNGLEDDIKDFLVKTSILDKLTPAACRALTDIGATSPVLRWLYVNGLFIVRLDERDAYCYHRVFKDFLQDRLGTSGMDKCALYQKLGWWLFDNNEITGAFECFAKAGDLYGISQVFKIIDLSNMTIEGFLKLTEYVTSMDTSALRGYPIIVAKMALIEFLKGNIAKMQSLYHTYTEWGEQGDLSLSPEEYAEYLWESGWLCYLDPDELTRANHKHRTFANFRYYVPHLKESHLARTALLSFPSFFRGVRDYGGDDVFDIEPILKRIENGEKYLIDEEEGLWKTYLLLAEYKYELEDFAAAEEIVRRVMTMAEDRRCTDVYFCCTVLLVKIMRAAHNTGEIDALTDRLEAIIIQNGHMFLLPNFHAFQARNRLAAGQAGLTEVFEQENKDYEDKPYFYLHYRHFTLVRGLLSLKNYSKAMLILGNLELMCQRYVRPTDLIEVNILKAVALYELGYEDEACGRLRHALAAAERYGYIRMFSDDAKDIWPVLELVRKQTAGRYIQSVVISCKKALAGSGHKLPAKKYAHAELTKTELGILKALQSKMSYTEIAHDNGIRVSTVKSHLHSIYSKLEVHNKTEAVLAAKEAGII